MIVMPLEALYTALALLLVVFSTVPPVISIRAASPPPLDW